MKKYKLILQNCCMMIYSVVWSIQCCFILFLGFVDSKKNIKCRQIYSLTDHTFFFSFPGMLRASRNIWLRGPYPNKMSVLAPPCSPLPSLALAPNQTFPPLTISPLPRRSKSCPLVPSILPLAASLSRPVHLPVQTSDSSGNSSTDEGHPLSFAAVVFS